MRRVPAAAFALVFTLLSAPALLAQADPTTPIPEHVAYRHAFHLVVVHGNMADDAQQHGQDKAYLRDLVRQRAGLNDTQGQSLRRIAAQCEAAVAAQDARAHAVILRFRQQYPFNMATKAFPLQPPPPELAGLQQERNNIILRARDQLRNELGEESFAKFDRFVKQRAAQDVQAFKVSQ